MQEAQVVRDFLFPADQQAPGAVEPGVGAFDFPAASRAAAAFRLRGLICFARHVRRIASRLSLAIDGFAGVPLVETEMLRLLGSGLGTFNWDGIQRLGNQFLVRHIGAVDGDAERHATAIDQRRTFDAQFAAIGRVFPGFFPHPAAIWLSPRPGSATSSRSLSDRRIRSGRVPIIAGMHLVSPTLGNRRESRCRSRTARASPSTGSPWTTHTGYRPRRFASAIAGVRPCDCAYKREAPDRSVSIKRRGSGETLMTVGRPFGTSMQIEKGSPLSALRMLADMQFSSRIGSKEATDQEWRSWPRRNGHGRSTGRRTLFPEME